MNFTIINKPYEMAHVGNPMLVTVQVNDDVKGMDVKVYINNVITVTLSYVPDLSKRITFDIAEVIKANISTAPISTDAPIQKVEAPSVSYKLELISKTSSMGYSSYIIGTAFLGGVSNNAYRDLSKAGLNMFSYRLNNHTRQFLFTTRTNTRNIILKESELAPFLFIHPGMPICFVSDRGRRLITQAQDKDSICALDVNAVRKAFFDTYKEVPSFISVLISDSYIFDIAISPAEKSPERKIIMFRNSLGCYERIELTGESQRQPEFEEKENYLQYDQGSALDLTLTGRTQLNDVLLLSSGVKRIDEVPFILDMLSSEDIYILEDSNWRKCTVTADEFQYGKRSEPINISLTVRLLDSNSMHLPDLDYQAPRYEFGEWILQDGQLNGFGFIYHDYTL